MAMTPDEIRAKSFPSVKKGGVDADVVSAYLEKVAQEMQRLQIDREATQREVPEVEAEAAPAEPAKRTIAVVGSHVDEVLEAFGFGHFDALVESRQVRCPDEHHCDHCKHHDLETGVGRRT